MPPRLTCPLIEFGCRRERCAWWDEKSKACAVVTNLETLREIKTLLSNESKPPAPESK